jgi:hypothetical protein
VVVGCRFENSSDLKVLVERVRHQALESYAPALHLVTVLVLPSGQRIRTLCERLATSMASSNSSDVYRSGHRRHPPCWSWIA